MLEKSSEKLKKTFGTLNFPMFILIVMVVAALALATAIDHKALADSLATFKNSLLANLGWLYILVGNAFLLLSIFLALSKYGHIRLGGEDAKPEFSFFAWVSLLISCGVGVGYAYWPVAESLWHYFHTPYLAEPQTVGARPVAIAISMFHWGFHTWSIYAIVGLAIAIPAFCLKKQMSVSGSLFGLLKERSQTGFVPPIVDFLCAISIIAGVSTGLGLGLIVLKGGLDYILAIDLGMFEVSLMLLLLIVCYMAAALSGLNKGIAYLAKANSYLALIWLSFIILAGPTVYMLNSTLESMGTYLSNMVYMALWTDSADQNNSWLKDWTIFYWLWWISWAPFCGGFLARISKGRTIREFMLGGVLVPSLVSVIWFGLLGSAAQYVELKELAPLWDVVQNTPGQGIYLLTDALGGGLLMSIIILVSMFIFMATTCDAASFFVGMQLSGGTQHPTGGTILISGLLMGTLAVVLMLSDGLAALQVGAILAGGIFIVVLMAMVISLFITLKEISPS